MSILITILVAAVVAGIVSAYVAEDKKPNRVKKDGTIYGSW